MPQKNWYNPLKKITPLIFRIETPTGRGTGFQLTFIERSGFCGIATADHVISHEKEWELPIRVTHHASSKSLLIKEEDRAILRYPEKDLAFILFHKKELPIDKSSPALIDENKQLKQGVEVGWCGFPSVAPPNKLCFFAGHISCPIREEDSFLVDGVAINGVSGGPVFYIEEASNKIKFAGVISEYWANRTAGETRPGLSYARSVEPYQATLASLKSLDEARNKEEEENKKKQEEAKTKEEKEKKETPAKKTKIPTQTSKKKAAA